MQQMTLVDNTFIWKVNIYGPEHMGESFQDYSWIKDFEKVSLKILK